MDDAKKYDGLWRFTVRYMKGGRAAVTSTDRVIAVTEDSVPREAEVMVAVAGLEEGTEYEPQTPLHLTALSAGFGPGLTYHWEVF